MAAIGDDMSGYGYIKYQISLEEFDLFNGTAFEHLISGNRVGTSALSVVHARPRCRRVVVVIVVVLVSVRHGGNIRDLAHLIGVEMGLRAVMGGSI